MLVVIEVKKGKGESKFGLKLPEMTHYSVRTELVEVFKNPSTGSGRTVVNILNKSTGELMSWVPV